MIENDRLLSVKESLGTEIAKLKGGKNNLKHDRILPGEKGRGLPALSFVTTTSGWLTG